jgi:hypothetical protein
MVQPEQNKIKLDIKINMGKSKSRKMRWCSERKIKVRGNFLAVFICINRRLYASSVISTLYISSEVTSLQSFENTAGYKLLRHIARTAFKLLRHTARTAFKWLRHTAHTAFFVLQNKTRLITNGILETDKRYLCKSNEYGETSRQFDSLRPKKNLKTFKTSKNHNTYDHFNPRGHYMYRQFNLQQFYVLPTQCIYDVSVSLINRRYIIL